MNREVTSKKLFLSSFLVFSIIIFDQGTKAMAPKFLPTVCNTGFAFGIWPGFWNELIVTLVILVIGYFLTRSHETLSSLQLLGFGPILGGGLSNLIDRIVRGCVVDFIDLKIWPAFNLADAAITLGVGILILSMFGQWVMGRPRV